jgi:hypothetical protein
LQQARADFRVGVVVFRGSWLVGSGLVQSWLVDDESDSAGEKICWGFSGVDLDEFYGKGPVVGTENETVRKKVHMAEAEMRAFANGKKVGTVGSILRDGVVVAINEHDGFREDEGIHGLRIGRRDAHGNEALPGEARIVGAGVKGLQDSGWEAEHGVDGGRTNVGFKECGSMGDNGNRVPRYVEGEIVGLAEDGKQVVGFEMLGRENAVHCIDGKLPAAVEEVGQVGLAEAGLAGEQGDT